MPNDEILLAIKLLREKLELMVHSLEERLDKVEEQVENLNKTVSEIMHRPANEALQRQKSLLDKTWGVLIATIVGGAAAALYKILTQGGMP